MRGTAHLHTSFQAQSGQDVQHFVLQQSGAQQSRSLSITQNIGNFMADQPEVEGQGHQACTCKRHINFHPFNAVVRQHCHTVTRVQTLRQQTRRQQIRTPVPLDKTQAAARIHRPDIVWPQAGVGADHV